MTIQQIMSIALVGLDGILITVEADSSQSMPTIEIIGLGDTAIKEAKERIRSSFKQIGLQLPPRKIIINLSPSSIKKSGTSFDFALAAAVYSLFFSLHKDRQKDILGGIFLGELGLDGTLKPIPGILPSLIAAKKNGHTKFFIPTANMAEAQCLSNITIFPFTNLLQFKEFTGLSHFTPFTIKGNTCTFKANKKTTLSIIPGQELAKRALTIASAGFHHILFCGPPGTGKSTLAASLVDILPPLTYEESLEISQIYSICGQLSTDCPMIRTRPFRIIHPTTTKIAIIGGGNPIMPGEISLAHRGVLFIDELPEHARETLESLRIPMETRTIHISRLRNRVLFPAHYLCIAAMNPCPCGFFKDPIKQCICPHIYIKKYQRKLSGPLRERFDVFVDLQREKTETIIDTFKNNTKNSSRESETINNAVMQAKEAQTKRFAGSIYRNNGDISGIDAHKFIKLEDNAETVLKEITKKLHLSPRVVIKTIKLARTIADIENKNLIISSHILEALQRRKSMYFMNDNE